LDIFQMGLQSSYFKMTRCVTEEIPQVQILTEDQKPTTELPGQENRFTPRLLKFTCLFFIGFVGVTGFIFLEKKTLSCYLLKCSTDTWLELEANSDLSTPKELGSKPFILLIVVMFVFAVVFLMLIYWFPPASQRQKQSVQEKLYISKSGTEEILDTSFKNGIFSHPLRPGIWTSLFYFLVVVVFARTIWDFSATTTSRPCNANEGWPFKEYSRDGHSDWLVKYGWFIPDNHHIKLTDASGKQAKDAVCKNGKMVWPLVAPKEPAETKA